MKVLPSLAVLTITGLSGFASAQNLIDDATFFSPAFPVRQAPVTEGLLSVTATNVQTSSNNGGSSWTNGAGGLIQARTALNGDTLGLSPLLGLGSTNIVEVDAQLYAETATTGSSLVFRRNISADTDVVIASTLFDTLGVDLDGIANTTVNSLVAANAVYNWSASKTTAASILAGQTYRVSFNVVAAGGLPLELLDSVTFGIANPTVDGAQGEDATTLNVLGLLEVGGGGLGSEYTFDFVSSTDLSNLDFNFAAQSVVGANLLGGTGALDYLTFSNMSVVAVPEPSGLALGALASAFLLIRRRR